MLLAPNDPPSPSSSSPQPDNDTNYVLIALGAALVTIIIIGGWALASGRVGVERAYLVMTPIPFLLMLWNAYGWLRAQVASRDLGLVFGGAGWLGVLVTLLLKHATVSAAIRDQVPVEQAQDGVFTWFVTFVSIGLLMAGGFYSYQRWQKDSISTP